MSDYDAAVHVTVREIRGDLRWTAGNADDGEGGLTGSVAHAVAVSEFVEAVVDYVRADHDPEDYEDGDTVGVFHVYDERPDDSDAETAVRDLSEVRIEPA